MEGLCDFLAGRHDVTHVGILSLTQRGGDADVDCIQLGNQPEIGGGAELPRFYQRGDFSYRHVLDVRSAGVNGVDFGMDKVDAGNRKSGFGELDGQGEAYVSKTYDSDSGSPVRYLQRQRTGMSGVFSSNR